MSAMFMRSGSPPTELVHQIVLGRSDAHISDDPLRTLLNVRAQSRSRPRRGFPYSHTIVLIECNELIYLHKILFVLKTSAGRTVRCA
jgi:hypothetical protein